MVYDKYRKKVYYTTQYNFIFSPDPFLNYHKKFQFINFIEYLFFIIIIIWKIIFVFKTDYIKKTKFTELTTYTYLISDPKLKNYIDNG